MGIGPVSRKTLSVLDAVAISVGIVIGAGIFKTPSMVAANSGNEWTVIFIWLIGGVVTLFGALCYAELTSAYPHSGGEYHYLNRAYGESTSFLFAWARMTVIQTGSIATLAFLFGDYASEIFKLGDYSSSWYGGLAVLVLTVVNIGGIRQGAWTQKIFTAAIVFGLLLMAVVGFFLVSPPGSPSAPLQNSGSSLGLALIFVLFTYGGWNEAAYISAEVKGSSRSMVWVLLISISVITAVYLIVNFVLLKSLGLSAVAGSQAVAADLMRGAFGGNGAHLISLLVITAALSTMNGVIITGARTNYAFGRDFRLFGFLGTWREQGSTPVNALLAQGAIALALVILGTATRNGFVTMVEYTAPIFWFFFLMVGISVFVLRRKDKDLVRPFRIPLYPIIPLLFCVFCIYMLRASILYTGKGALWGIVVLLAGIPLLFIKGSRSMEPDERRNEK
jgi:basic amino acid/polyamine antiporter, APA family